MKKLRLYFFISLGFLFCGTVNAQTMDYADKLISKIKVRPELQEKLRQRFKLFAEYETRKNYEKQFELIYPQLIASENCREFFATCFADKQDFINRQKSAEKYYGNISEISLLNSQKRLDEKRNQLGFIIQAKSDRKQFIVFSLDVFLENGQWYFSTLYTIEF